jgi:hypothetical protein
VTNDQIVAAADKIKRSSAYAAGNPTTFKTVFIPGAAELPAPSDPAVWMADVQAKLKFSMPKEARICVFGGGYGGLAAFFLAQGAKQVVVIEPRFRFHAGLDMVTPILDEIYAPEHTETIKSFKAWPQQGHVESLGKFDLVIAPEGFDECPEPVETLTALLKLAHNHGGLVMEVVTGESTTVPAGKVNSWRPTAEVFGQLLLKVNQGKEFRDANGRAENRRLFAVRAGSPEKPEIAKTTFSEPMPRPVKKPQPAEIKAPEPKLTPKPVPKPAPVPPPPPPPAPVAAATSSSPTVEAPEPLVETKASAEETEAKADLKSKKRRG